MQQWSAEVHQGVQAAAAKRGIHVWAWLCWDVRLKSWSSSRNPAPIALPARNIQIKWLAQHRVCFPGAQTAHAALASLFWDTLGQVALPGGRCFGVAREGGWSKTTFGCSLFLPCTGVNGKWMDWQWWKANPCFLLLSLGCVLFIFSLLSSLPLEDFLYTFVSS